MGIQSIGKFLNQYEQASAESRSLAEKTDPYGGTADERIKGIFLKHNKQLKN